MQLSDIAINGALVGIGVPILGKAHEIAIHTREKHGTMLKWDKAIASARIRDNFKGTVTIGIVAAIVFSTATWVARVNAREVDNYATQAR